jgi:predicted metal-dependent hydrolase
MSIVNMNAGQNNTRKKKISTRSGLKKPVVVGEFELELSGRKVKYVLKRSRAARLVWLKISRDAGLTVTVPFYYNCETLSSYLSCRSGWILRNLDKFSKAAPIAETDNSPLPETIPYLGQYFTLKLNPGKRGFTAVPLDSSVLGFNLHLTLGEPSRQSLKNWLRDQATRVINERVKKIGMKMQSDCHRADYNRVYIRDQKSRWGSCSAKRNLSFNWRLIMVPESIIDYVIIHELCHLKEMNHSKTFWKLVAEYCPEWRLQRKWLNEHCSELNSHLP